MVLLHRRQSRTLSGGDIPLQTIHGDGGQGFVVECLESQREQELAEARAIQVGMLPHGVLPTADITICYEFQPFYEVDGDFLDFSTLTGGVIGICLGDVTGKGLPAALYAALAVGALRGVHKTGTPPATVLSMVN